MCFSLLVQRFTPLDGAKDRTNTSIEMLFTEKVRRKVLLILSYEFQALTSGLLFRVCLLAELIIQCRTPEIYAVVLHFAVKQNLLANFRMHLIKLHRMQFEAFHSM